MSGGTQDNGGSQNAQQETTQQPHQPVIVTGTKSIGIALLLTVLFGPLGMLYVTIPGAIIMVVIAIVLAIIPLVGWLLALVTWPIAIIWAALAARSYNKKLLAGVRQY